MKYSIINVILLILFSYVNSQGWSFLNLLNSEDIGNSCVTQDGSNGILSHYTKCNSKYLYGKVEDSDNFYVSCCPSTTRFQKISGNKAKEYCKTYGSIIESDKIIDGTFAEAGEFPFMALLFKRTIEFVYIYLCGGSLISDKFVITAGHCHRKYPGEEFFVTFGKIHSEYRYGLDPLEYKVEEFHSFPNYTTSSRYNDIALIELEKSVTFKHRVVSPVCLMTTENSDNSLQKFTVAGFGRTDANRDDRSKFLLKAEVNEVNQEECKRNLFPYKTNAKISNGVLPSQLCAKPPNGTRQDTCQGDSGGPLLVDNNLENKYYLVGLTSFGLSCGSNFPSVYTRVSSYIDWIEDKVWPDLE